MYVLIQATEDNTTFTVDLNGDGTPDQLNRNATKSLADGDMTTISLSRGQTFLLDRISACTTNLTTCITNPGNLNSGTFIQGNKTLQVKFVAGNPDTISAARLQRIPSRLLDEGLLRACRRALGRHNPYRLLPVQPQFCRHYYLLVFSFHIRNFLHSRKKHGFLQDRLRSVSTGKLRALLQGKRRFLGCRR